MQWRHLPEGAAYQGEGRVVVGKVDLDNQVKVANIIITAGWGVSPHHHLTLILHPTITILISVRLHRCHHHQGNNACGYYITQISCFNRSVV